MKCLSSCALALVCSIVVLGASQVRAQDATGEVIPLTYQGVEGVWFPLAEARAALAIRVERDSLITRLSLTEESLTLAEEEIASLNASIATAAQALGEEATARQAAEAERDAWYRSPWLWLGVGLVVGVVGVVVAAAAIGT